MKKKLLLITSLIIILLIGLILYKNELHYTNEIDGVKLALTLDNNSIDYLPNDNDYYVDIKCSNVIGEYLYDENEDTFKLTFKNIKTGARCSIDFKSQVSTLIDIVENEAQYEDNIPTGFAKLSQNGYVGDAPITLFYTSFQSNTVTSGNEDPDATLTFDSTNNMWVTDNLTKSRYYYYFFNVTTEGSYQFCWNQNSGNGTNVLYIYKGTNYITDSYSIEVKNSLEECFGIGSISEDDTIKVAQYTATSDSGVSSLSFGFKKSSTTTNAGYRYEGEDPNNYVWFNNELWRIIGSVPTKINDEGTKTNLVKIIRATSIGGLVWNKSTPRPNWNSSTLYTLLNSYYYGAKNATGNTYCYGDSATSKSKCDYRYIGINPSGYYGSMIKEVYWNTGETQTNNKVDAVYADEIDIQSISGRIGIMNASDYGFSSSYNRTLRQSLNSYSSSNISLNNWLYSQGEEWTITPYSIATTYALFIHHTGTVGSNTGIGVKLSNSVRPVVYLDPTLYVVSGDGSQATPYKIAWPSGS